MTLQQMIEEVQKHAPDKGHTEIINLLNRAMDVFCEETRIIRNTDTITTVASTIKYDLATDVSTIRSVEFDGVPIARLLYEPEIGDDGNGVSNHYWFIDGSQIGIIKNGSTIAYNDAGSTVTVKYYGLATHLSSSSLSASPEFSQRFHEALVNYVLWHVYQEPLHVNMELASWFYKGYQLMVKQAKKYASKRKINSPTLVPYEY